MDTKKIWEEIDQAVVRGERKAKLEMKVTKTIGKTIAFVKNNQVLCLTAITLITSIAKKQIVHR